MKVFSDRRGSILLATTFLISACVQPTEEAGSVSGNRPPVIQSLTAQPLELPVGESSTVTVVASDPDNNPLSYHWSASTGDIIGDGPSVRFTASFCCAGPNFVTVTVKDNAGGGVTQSLDILIYY